MAVLTIIKYTAISVEDAELSVDAARQGQETDHKAFVRKIKTIAKNHGRQTFPRRGVGKDG